MFILSADLSPVDMVSAGIGLGAVLIESVVCVAVSVSDGVIVCTSFLQLTRVSPRVRAIVITAFIYLIFKFGISKL
jgi:hypothetical protein